MRSAKEQKVQRRNGRRILFFHRDPGKIRVEAGPEMVGTIGGSTAVANNDQIVKGITDGVMIGVARAMQQSGGTQKIVIEADGDTEGLLNFITFKQKENERQYGM